jgi:NADH-quinone oxidoreductase subunit C
VAVSDLGLQLDAFSHNVVAKVTEAFPEDILAVGYFRDELTIVLGRGNLPDVCTFLRDEPELRFNVLTDLSAVDMLPEHPRFEVNVQLLALRRDAQPGQGTRRVRLKVRLKETDARMPTLTGVWPSSAWYERETYELFGIEFDGLPDPRPLLLPEDWEGTPPMRRDVPVLVEEVAFSFNRERIDRGKSYAKE